VSAPEALPCAGAARAGRAKQSEAKQGGYLRLRLRPCARPQVHPTAPVPVPVPVRVPEQSSRILCGSRARCAARSKRQPAAARHVYAGERPRGARRSGRRRDGMRATGLAAGNGQCVGLMVRRERARAVGSVRWGWAGRSKRRHAKHAKRSDVRWVGRLDGWMDGCVPIEGAWRARGETWRRRRANGNGSRRERRWESGDGERRTLRRRQETKEREKKRREKKTYHVFPSVLLPLDSARRRN
jgi:hypothetical protein